MISYIRKEIARAKKLGLTKTEFVLAEIIQLAIITGTFILYMNIVIDILGKM